MNDTDIQTQPTTDTPSSNKAEKIAKIGTIISAIMASSCCWLPLVLLALGVSGAGIASTLDAYRPLLIVVTVGFLGAAFYFTNRPQKAVADGGHDCCAPASKNRFNLKAFNKAVLWIATVMAVAFLLFPTYVGAFLSGGDEVTVTEDMNRAVIKVEGMTCEGCSALVAKAIRTVPGVLAVEVSYEKGEALVGVESGYSVPIGGIIEALKKADYRGVLVEE